MSRSMVSRRALICSIAVAALAPRSAWAAPQDADAIPTYTFAGSPQELGRAHARALGGAIHTLMPAYVERVLGSESRYRSVLAMVRPFEKLIEPAYLTELRALAKGSQLSTGVLLLGNTFLDMMPSVGCSTIALPPQAAPDEVLRLGRNLDFFSLGIADRQSALMIFKPEGRFAFASVSWPGLIGVISGINQHGLALANMEVPRAIRPATGTPYTLLYRGLLEQARTVDEAIDLLKDARRQTANNLILVDPGNRRAVAEITPEKVTVRRAPGDKPLISTNHQRGQDLSTPGRCRRYDALWSESTEQFGHIDPVALERMLEDVAQVGLTIQSMIFEPGTMTLRLSVGQKAAYGPFREIALAPLLK